jgi:hypothetical protein
MISFAPSVLLGGVTVQTTENRGFTPQELAARAADKIISVGDNSHPAIREQALAFKARIQSVVEFYLEEAVRQDRVTIANRLSQSGNSELLKLLED